MAEQDRKEIDSLAIAANPNMEMFNARKSDRDFTLNFEKII
jgi:hypothetical protein